MARMGLSLFVLRLSWGEEPRMGSDGEDRNVLAFAHPCHKLLNESRRVSGFSHAVIAADTSFNDPTCRAGLLVTGEGLVKVLERLHTEFGLVQVGRNETFSHNLNAHRTKDPYDIVAIL